ncbi:LytTR family DNA-binding domain-containing protein [Persicitalea sp.]|uniref:LytTR family DNA-binding domain-containing protein n=1 Tax=Persicitalea sp. TaxID=3100273 RepID=UPI0035930862
MNSSTNPQPASVHIGAHTAVPAAEVVFCQGDRNYTQVHFADRPKLTLSVTLRIIHERLGKEGFLRVSRSALVNKEAIAEYDGQQVILFDGLVLPVARRRRRFVRLTLRGIFSTQTGSMRAGAR